TGPQPPRARTGEEKAMGRAKHLWRSIENTSAPYFDAFGPPLFRSSPTRIPLVGDYGDRTRCSYRSPNAAMQIILSRQHSTSTEYFSNSKEVLAGALRKE
ncbi:hypothetical protein BaRGS_00036815, partial [Batillaria attramentaria]